MNTFIIGILAGTLCTLSFVPQVIKIFKTKNVNSLSLPAFTALALGVSLWLVYGIIISDLPIILANAVTLLLILSIVIMLKKYKNNC